jgi:L-galactose dehydrogenase
MRFQQFGATGVSLSAIGFGASPFGDVFRPTDARDRLAAVHEALNAGINVFDVSPFYGRTLAEERLGEALAGHRHDVFLSTKCGRYDNDCFDFSANRIESSIEESLRRLRTDYVDLLLAHDIEFADQRQILEETLPALRRIRQAGKTRFIGVSSYQLGLLAQTAQSGLVDGLLSYCRYNLLIDDMDTWLTPIAKSRGIGLINASPLHMGILSPSGAPAWHPAPAEVKAAGERIVELCERQGINPSALALRYCIDHPYVATTLVGMSDGQQVRENLQALTLEIDPQLAAGIARIVAPVKNLVWPSGLPENAARENFHTR